MIKILVDKDYRNVQVVSDNLGKLDKLLTYMKRKAYESIGNYASVLDLYEWVGVSFLDTNAEMMNWVWTSLDGAKIDSNIKDNEHVLKFPPARKCLMINPDLHRIMEEKYYPLTPPPEPYKELHINIPRGCGKTMTAVEMIKNICENTKLREEINSKIKKYSDTDFYGYRFMLEYRHQPCEKRYRVEYRIPFDSPCLLEFWPDEEVDKYFDEQENKARKELIDRVIKDINEGDANNMPVHMNIDLGNLTGVPKYTAIYEPIPTAAYSNIRVRLPKITNIEMYNDRVVKVTFDDGSFTKSVCQENDVFDLDVGITICLIKKMLDAGKGNGTRIYNDIIRDAHKLINDKENEKMAKKMEKEKAKKKTHKVMKKKQAKKMNPLENLRTATKEEAIDIQKQAFIRAMQELEMTKDGM